MRSNDKMAMSLRRLSAELPQLLDQADGLALPIPARAALGMVVPFARPLLEQLAAGLVDDDRQADELDEAIVSLMWLLARMRSDDSRQLLISNYPGGADVHLGPATLDAGARGTLFEANAAIRAIAGRMLA